jgi:transcriptional regulator with XRE-family HTH domain
MIKDNISYIKPYRGRNTAFIGGMRYKIRWKGGRLMYEEYTQDRIAQLRIQKGVSARDMSLSLGQNNSYINQIENRKALPSLQGLFYICEYFGITPQQFFDEGDAYPVQLAELVEDMKKLDATTLTHISAIVREILSKQRI